MKCLHIFSNFYFYSSKVSFLTVLYMRYCRCVFEEKTLSEPDEPRGLVTCDREEEEEEEAKGFRNRAAASPPVNLRACSVGTDSPVSAAGSR